MDYGMEFLKSKGFFEDEYTDVVRVNGNEQEYRFDSKNRLAYIEYRSKDLIIDTLKQLKAETVLDIFWFWNGKRLCVYREGGENPQFIYNLEHHMPDEYTKGKTSKLEDFSTRNVTVLFETSEVINRFYQRMWILRLDLARSIESPISDQDKLLVSQRIIDRVIFMYFLVEKGIVHLEPVHEISITRRLFQNIVSMPDFYDVLCKMSFRMLNRPGLHELKIPDLKSQVLRIPYLNSSLFRERSIPTDAGSIRESKIGFEGFDWNRLIQELNHYNWLIGYTSEETEGTFGNLTPEILGHIYERFIISISELDDIKLDSLSTDEQGTLRYGRKEIGAYYTPSAITVDMAEHSLCSWLGMKLEYEAKDGSARKRLREMVEGRQEESLEFLKEIRVLDPSVGSGAFLLAYADVLLDMRRLCGDKEDEYSLRESIIVENLYGVDIKQGAAEICMLRMWLWLAAGYQEGMKVEPLPNVNFNIRCGNSLLGIASESLGRRKLRTFLDEELGNQLKFYGEEIELYKREHNENQEDILNRLNENMKEKLNELLARVLDVYITKPISSLDRLEEELGRGKEGEAKVTIKKKGYDQTERLFLDARQFAVRTYSAWKRFLVSNPTQVKNVREVVRKFLPSSSEISLQRRVHRKDISEMSPLHWIMEFPHIYLTGSRFDVVVGNPPHGASMTDTEQEIYDWLYALSENRRDIAKFFTERAYDLSDFVLAFVVPKSCTYTTKWEDFRSFIKPHLTRTVDLGVAFSHVRHEQCSFELGRGRKDEEYEVAVLDEEITPLGRIEKGYDEDTILIDVSPREMKIIERILSQTKVTMGDLNMEVFRGEKTSFDENGRVCIKGNEVSRFLLRGMEYRIRPHRIRKTYKDLYCQPKAIAQRLVAHIRRPQGHLKIMACYDEKNVNYETVINLVPREGDEIQAKVIVVLLNSAIVNFFVYTKLYNKAIRNIDFDKYYIERIPYPDMTAEEERMVSFFCDMCTRVRKDSQPKLYQTTKMLTDYLIYEAYLFEASERKLSHFLSKELAPAKGSLTSADWKRNISKLMGKPVFGRAVRPLVHDEDIRFVEERRGRSPPSW